MRINFKNTNSNSTHFVEVDADSCKQIYDNEVDIVKRGKGAEILYGIRLRFSGEMISIEGNPVIQDKPITKGEENMPCPKGRSGKGKGKKK